MESSEDHDPLRPVRALVANVVARVLGYVKGGTKWGNAMGRPINLVWEKHPASMSEITPQCK